MRSPPGGLNKQGRTGEQKGKKIHPPDFQGNDEDGFQNLWRRVDECGYSKNKRVQNLVTCVVIMKHSDPNCGWTYLPRCSFLSATKWQVEYFSHSNGTILIRPLYESVQSSENIRSSLLKYRTQLKQSVLYQECGPSRVFINVEHILDIYFKSVMI